MTDADDLSVDAILDVLSHAQRRELLAWLREQPEKRADEQEILSHLIDYEEQRTGTVPHTDNIKASLHHVHQPKLANMGLVTYDEGAQEFEYHENEPVEKWLDMIVEELPDDQSPTEE